MSCTAAAGRQPFLTLAYRLREIRKKFKKLRSHNGEC